MSAGADDDDNGSILQDLEVSAGIAWCLLHENTLRNRPASEDLQSWASVLQKLYALLLFTNLPKIKHE